MENHHHQHDPAAESDWAAMAELLDLDADVLHSYLSEVTAWVYQRSAELPRRRILDLGSGTGTGALALVQCFAEADVIALDKSGPLLARCQAKARELGVEDRIRTVQADLDAAWLAASHNMTELMEYTRAGQKIPLPLRLRVRRDQVLGTGQAIGAVDLLFENSGGRALKTGTPIQRFWRDAHAGRVHAINDPERALSMFGRGEFGHDVPPDAMV